MSHAFRESTKTWNVTTEPVIEDTPEFHHVYLATGSEIDIEKLPFLQKMHNKHPINSSRGFPQLTDDLMWDNEIPLFATGKLAALQLGPGAANLDGARLGAERIAWAVGQLLDKSRGQSIANASRMRDQDDQTRYVNGVGNKFDSLSLNENE